jgi:hypothetical protein
MKCSMFPIKPIKNMLSKIGTDFFNNLSKRRNKIVLKSVADPDPNPDPDPPDPHVFGPYGSGSGSISQGHGSGFFYLKQK